MFEGHGFFVVAKIFSDKLREKIQYRLVYIFYVSLVDRDADLCRCNAFAARVDVMSVIPVAGKTVGIQHHIPVSNHQNTVDFKVPFPDDLQHIQQNT